MNWTPDYKCPICEDSATQHMPKLGDFDEVDCPDCGRYRISGSAKAIAANSSYDERLQALENAKSAAEIGRLPLIGGYDFR